MVPCYFMTAIGGLLAVWSISSLIEKRQSKIRNLLVFIGNNTLTILTWHFLCFKIVSLAIILIYGLPITRLAEFPVIVEFTTQGWFIVYFIIGIGIPLAFSRNKYLK